MTDDQIEKIKRLVEQGATEGEREAARQALKRKIPQGGLWLDQSNLMIFSVRLQIGDIEHLVPIYSVHRRD